MLISPRTSRLLSAGALVLAASALSSCSTEEGTDAIYTPAQGVNDRTSRVDVLNAMIVSSHENSGTFITTLVNNEVKDPGGKDQRSDRLVGLTVDGKPVQLKAPVKVAAAGKAVLAAGIPGAVPGIKVSGDFAAGDFVEVVLTFATADPVTIEVPVLANTEGTAFAGQDGPAVPADEPAHGGEEGEGDH